MDKPAILEKLAGLGITPVAQFEPGPGACLHASELARWQPLVKKLGIAL